MLTRHGTRFPVAVKLLVTALSVAFSVTFASAFSWRSVSLADAATVPVHPRITASATAPLTFTPAATHSDLASLSPVVAVPVTTHSAAPVTTHSVPVTTHSVPVTTPPATHSVTPAAKPVPTSTHSATYPSATAAPAQTYSGGVLTRDQVGQLWLEAGGPEWAESHAVEIAYCESGFNPRAYNPSGASGLWQILGAPEGWTGSTDWFDPSVNAAAAVAKFKDAGDSFAPWVCQ